KASEATRRPVVADAQKSLEYTQGFFNGNAGPIFSTTHNFLWGRNHRRLIEVGQSTCLIDEIDLAHASVTQQSCGTILPKGLLLNAMISQDSTRFILVYSSSIIFGKILADGVKEYVLPEDLRVGWTVMGDLQSAFSIKGHILRVMNLDD